MKMKMFGKEDSKKILEMEDEVNQWLTQNPNIEVIDIRQSAAGGSMANTKVYITIWYEDQK